MKKESFDEAVQAATSGDFASVDQLRKGRFSLEKVPRMALEVYSIESVGQCFQLVLCDAFG